MVKALNIIKQLFSEIFDLSISILLHHQLVWISAHASQRVRLHAFIPVIASLIGLCLQLVSKIS